MQLTAELFKAVGGRIVRRTSPTRARAWRFLIWWLGSWMCCLTRCPGMPHVRDGRLRALAVTTLKRTRHWPLDLPPVADTLPGFGSSTWFGLYGPKGLPAEVVNRA